MFRLPGAHGTFFRERNLLMFNWCIFIFCLCQIQQLRLSALPFSAERRIIPPFWGSYPGGGVSRFPVHKTNILSSYVSGVKYKPDSGRPSAIHPKKTGQKPVFSLPGVHSRDSCPVGTTENSPAIHCRGPAPKTVFCPVGTTENSPAIHCRGPCRKSGQGAGCQRHQ